MKQCIKSGAAHPVLTATAAWLVLWAIMVAVQVYHGYEFRGLEVPFTSLQIVAASVVGAGVGTLISRRVMRRRQSLMRRILSAVVSLVLATIADFVAGIVVMFVTRVSGCAAGDILLGLAIPVAGLTGSVFGFSGGASEKRIPAKSGSQS